MSKLIYFAYISVCHHYSILVELVDGSLFSVTTPNPDVYAAKKLVKLRSSANFCRNRLLSIKAGKIGPEERDLLMPVVLVLKESVGTRAKLGTEVTLAKKVLPVATLLLGCKLSYERRSRLLYNCGAWVKFLRQRRAVARINIRQRAATRHLGCG